MNLVSPAERERYFQSFKKEWGERKDKEAEIVLCPPSVHLEAFSKLKRKKLSIGAQNIFWERSGSFTGEISPSMAKNAGAEFVICGHSERRKYFKENDEEVNLKVKASLRIGLIPIICVGETKQEKDGGKTFSIISGQIKKALAEVSRTKAEQIILAYEPVWAVGSDTIPTSYEIMQVRVLIKKILVGMFEKKYADKVRILYGGSVNAKTAGETCVEPGMDGVLVGRESLAPYEFLKIAEIINL